MKKCPKCGFENTEDSLFCENCGTKLDQPKITPKRVDHTSNSQDKSHQKVITILSAVIVILVALILFFLGARSGHSTTSSNHRQVRLTAKKQKHTDPNKMQAHSMNQKEKIAAVIYYASGNNIQSWDKFDLYAQHGALTQQGLGGNDEHRFYKQGSNPIRVQANGLGKGGGEFFTTDGDKVYLYRVPDGPGSEDETIDQTIEEFSHPQASTTWSDIAKFVNNHHAGKQVHDLANNMQVTQAK